MIEEANFDIDPEVEGQMDKLLTQIEATRKEMYTIDWLQLAKHHIDANCMCICTSSAASVAVASSK